MKSKIYFTLSKIGKYIGRAFFSAIVKQFDQPKKPCDLKQARKSRDPSKRASTL